jgi:hypothetical protein
MVEVCIAEYFGIGEALVIIGTMFVVLYFSRRHMQRLTVDVHTKVLNDLDEKVRKMAKIIIEKPSMQRVIYKPEKTIRRVSVCVLYPVYLFSCIFDAPEKSSVDEKLL